MDPLPKLSDALTATPGALTRIGCALMGSGQGAKAAALVRELLARQPGDPELTAAARTILSHRVPQWHWPMLADADRNQAFRAAIERAVTPETKMLDIGTGSGLLAMVAARAGAAWVTACEADEALAATARDIVAANGFAGRVQVIAKRSTELDRDEIDGGADLIVAEIFADDLLKEGALGALAHARGELAAPGAQIIPAAASIQVALAWWDYRPTDFEDICGFDLSKFERHIAPELKVGTDHARLALRSEQQTLFAFDFAAAEPARPARSRLTLAARGGPANGAIRWLRLELDEETRYENRPGEGRRSHWAALFDPLPRGQVVAEDETATVEASHDGERALLWFPLEHRTERG